MVAMLRDENLKLENKLSELEGVNRGLQDDVLSQGLIIQDFKRLKFENQNLKNELDKVEKKLICKVRDISEIMPLLHKIEILEEQVKMVKQTEEKVKKLEQDKLQMNHMIEEQKALNQLKIEELENHIKVVNVSNGELKEKIKNGIKPVKNDVGLKELQEELQMAKSKLQVYEQKQEDLVFFNNQLQQSLDSFKSEMKEMSSKLSDERKVKHDQEIEIIELKDRYSDIQMAYQNLNQDLVKLKNEISFANRSLQEQESDLKKERRKLANVEREYDQLIYQHQSYVKESNQIALGLKDKSEKLKLENDNLNHRLQTTFSDFQKKMEEERVSHLATKQKLKTMEEYAERVDIENENLKKKSKLFQKSKFLQQRQKILKFERWKTRNMQTY